MLRTSITRLVSSLALSTAALLAAGLLTSCAASGRARTNSTAVGWAHNAGLDLATVEALASSPQDIPSMDQVHPRTMITFGLGLGEQTNETNSGNPATGIATSATDSQRFRLRGEHFFESGFGVFAEGYLGMAEDIDEDLGSTDSSQDSSGLFVAAAFRATLDDDFRLPVRFGPFFQRTELDDVNFIDGAIERSTVGVRLSAEPEYIIFQRNNGGKISELSAFGEIRAGAGPSKVKDNVDSEDAYAFTLDYEVGIRYRFGFGLLTSISYVASKYHFGTSESYNNAVFFGIDDDYNGIMITAGMRF